MTATIDTFDHDDPWHQILMVVFFGSVSMLWFYSISRWTNLINSLFIIYNDWGRCPKDPIPGQLLEEPTVTVQIATYNEGSVVGETIARACSLDWPKDKLFVQICDDSTEKESTALIENLILCWREKGFHVERLSRDDRVGYKAGNLQHNFRFIKGDYVAYLDADHLVEPDFLRRTIPHFYDDNGKSKSHIGLVQTPWCYYNTHQNLLTECDALGLDIHHVIEQVGRCSSYKVFGFNGTGGIWRKQAVSDAGGFSWETVTEDLLLSYKAFLKGYEFVYVRDAPQALEVPSCILAHVQQKQRWTKGFMQVLRMYYGSILFSKHAPFAVKLEALMHLSGPLQLIAAMAALLTYPYLVFHGIDSFLVKVVSILALTEPVAAALHAVVSKISGENKHYEHWYSKVARVMTILPYFALRFGMTPFETKAIIEGFFSNDATFHTTPKEGSNSSVSTVKRAQKVVRARGDDIAAGVGLFLAIHQFIYVFAFDLHLPRHSIFDVIVRALNLMICIGLFCVSTMFFLAKHPSVGRRAVHALANTRHVILSISLLAYTIGYMTCFMSGNEIDFAIANRIPINNTHYKIVDDSISLQPSLLMTMTPIRPLSFNDVDTTINADMHDVISLQPNVPTTMETASPFAVTDNSQITDIEFQVIDESLSTQPNPLTSQDATSILACSPKTQAKRFSPVVALGLPRSGSTLMFNFLTELGSRYPNIDNLSLYETFAPVPSMQLPGLTRIVDLMRKNCDGLEPSEKSLYQQRFDFESDVDLYENLRKDSHPEIYEPLITAHSNRYEDPSGWLHYVESIPSTGDFGYVEYKIFDHDLEKLGISAAELIDSLHSPDTKFLINYRRNLLESYVSQKIAEASGNWVEAKTTSDDAITINRQEFEKYIHMKVTYFQEIRDHLEKNRIPFEVVEYNRDLGAEPQQRETLRSLQRLLRLPEDDTVVDEIMSGLRRRKQSTVPVREQIGNWEEVVQWGLGKEHDEDWDDLFGEIEQPFS